MNALSNVNAPKDTVTDGVALIARIVMSIMFITSGIGKLVGFGPTVDHIAEKGVPLPEIAAVIAILIEVGGGLAVLFGWKTRQVSVMGLELSILSAGERTLGGIMPFDKKHGHPSHWISYVTTADVDATCAQVKSLGGKVCVGGMDIPPGRFALCASLI